jgi:hypothetical protein
VARRIRRAGCLDALRIMPARRSLEAIRPLSNRERAMCWRERTGQPGAVNAHFQFKWEPFRPTQFTPASAPPPRRSPALHGVEAGSLKPSRTARSPSRNNRKGGAGRRSTRKGDC